MNLLAYEFGKLSIKFELNYSQYDEQHFASQIKLCDRFCRPLCILSLSEFT